MDPVSPRPAEDTLRELVIVCFAQKRVIIGTATLIMAAAVAVAFFWPPTYEAAGAILVKGKPIEKSPTALEPLDLRMFELNEEDLISETQILTSPDVIRRALARLGQQGILLTDSAGVPADTVDLVMSIRRRLRTAMVPKSNIIRVTLSQPDHRRATAILAILMDEYIHYREDVHHPEAAAGFYQVQADKFKKDLQDQQDRLGALAALAGTPSPAEEIRNNLIVKKDLDQQINLVDTQRISQQGHVRMLDRALASEELQFFAFVANEAIQAFGEKLQDLVVERGTLLRVFHPESAKIMRVDEQIRNVSGRLHREVQIYAREQHSRLQALEETVAALRQRRRQLDQENLRLQGHLTDVERTRLEIDLLQHSYSTFAKRLKEARITSSSAANRVFSLSIVQTPFSTGKPVFPNRRVVLPMGLLAGLVGGFSLGFLREFFDHTVKRPEDIARISDVPTLFSIPDWDA